MSQPRPVAILIPRWSILKLLGPMLSHQVPIVRPPLFAVRSSWRYVGAKLGQVRDKGPDGPHEDRVGNFSHYHGKSEDPALGCTPQ
eukprot:4932419-Karenia_brevis.AAC.1